MANDELLQKLLGGEQKREHNIGTYLRIMWRKKHLIIIPLVLSWIIAVVGLQYIPLTYRAGSSVAIESNVSFTRDLEMLLDEQASHRQDVSELDRVRAEIRNQDFLDEIIEVLDLGRTPLIREKAQQLIDGPLTGEPLGTVVNRLAAEEIRKRVEVRFGSAGVYNIRTESHNPGNAYILNKVITRKYVESRRQKELAEITAKGDFSDEQVAIYKEKLNFAEQELERFKQLQQETAAMGNPVDASNVIVAEEIKSSYLAELSNMETEVTRYRTNLRRIYRVVPTSERLMSDSNLRSISNIQINTMLLNLVESLGRRGSSELSLTETIEDASVGRSRAAYRESLINLVQQVYGDQGPREQEQIVNYYYRLMLVGSFQEIVDTLNRYINNFRDNLSGQAGVEAEMNRRTAERDKYREFLDAFQQQSTSARITRAIQASQLASRIEIRDHAVRPIRPIKPNKPRLQMMFLAVGLITGLGLVFLSEMFNRSFTDVKEIESVLDLPVLGTIPAMAKGPGQAKIQRRKNTLMWVIAMVLFVVVMAGMMFFLKSLHSRPDLYMNQQAVEEMIP
jgi:polysaccharide biosynthesis transport protein